MRTVYKLTDHNGQTYGNMQWGEGVKHTATGKGRDLCTDGWIHFYESPLLAVLLNPIHADYSNPILWEARSHGRIKKDGQLKAGAKGLTTLRQIPLPQFTTTQRVAFAIFCGLKVYKESAWQHWAEKWLSGEDRSYAAASTAARAAYAAALAADAAAYATYAAARAAAYAAAYAAALAANTATYAAAHAAALATDATDAADAAAINLHQLAERAYNFERDVDAEVPSR